MAEVKKIEVIRKRQLAQSLVEKTGLKLKTSVAVIDYIFDEIGDAMVKGKKVNIKDFGIFVKAKRAARMGRNPATGEPIKIKASTKPRFTASKALKESMTARKYPEHADAAALTIFEPAPVKKVAKKTTAKKTTAKKKTTRK